MYIARTLTGALLVACSLAWAGSAEAGELRAGGHGHIPGHYIVVLHADADPGVVARDVGVAPGLLYHAALKGFSGQVPDHAMAALLRHPDVDYVEPDGLAWAIGKPPWAGGPGDGGEDPPPAGQVTPWGIERVGGPQVADEALRAWIIDTGISDHADLAIDRNNGANFVTKGKKTTSDGDGHGTHVAGTIAALDNDIDVVGVAPGTLVVPVRVLDNKGSGYISWIVAGIDHVALNAVPGDVANLSLGADGHWQTLHDAVLNLADQGVAVTIAAGNDGLDAAGQEPAHVEHNNVYTVSASDDVDCMPYWSNWGNPPIDFAAPGVDILSLNARGGTTTMDGTSMAAPHVAGLLLGGEPMGDGFICNDVDGTPDPMAHR